LIYIIWIVCGLSVPFVLGDVFRKVSDARKGSGGFSNRYSLELNWFITISKLVFHLNFIVSTYKPRTRK